MSSKKAADKPAKKAADGGPAAGDNTPAVPAAVHHADSASAASDAAARPPPPPSVARQRAFIAENSAILDFDTMKTILRIVMMEVGKTVTVEGPDGPAEKAVVLENGTTREVSINLDHIQNEEVVLHLYNIVSNRRAALNEPAHGGKH